MNRSRRQFLQSSTAFAIGFTGLQRLVAGEDVGVSSLASASTPARPVFGPLQPDPDRLIDLPADFSYKIVSRAGQVMADELLVPDKPDGMATFAGADGLTIVVRNHEIDPSMQGPFGGGARLLDKVDTKLIYDLGERARPCIGGTTTVVYDTRNQQVVRQYLSLSGTIRNCAGGPTPWGSWITCEEASDRRGLNQHDNHDTLCQEDHGYNFEVPASVTVGLHKAVPLKPMGRFRHEAVAVEPKSGIVYQTEDIKDGLIYRFLPKIPGQLRAGGQLQALALVDHVSADTRNWSDDLKVSPGDRFDVRWIDLDNVESPEDDLRYRGFNAGAARFARGEGMWYADGDIYFACTNGGAAELGQIWKYTPSVSEGKGGESNDPGTLELFIEPNNSNLVANADNLTAAPWGDLVVCEDRSGDVVRLVGVTPEGECYTLANNRSYGELAGVCFSPDGSTLFVNIQHEGLTLAITGPWPTAISRG
ncbi:MAG: alkaline phosphatase PhoX [Planctomycetota bacterium]